MMTYKGYTAVAKLDAEAGILFGRVIDLRDAITFQGTTVEELRRSFEESVDFYLECCEADGVAPEKPYTGRILVRTQPETHRRLAILAEEKGESVNAIINRLLARATTDLPPRLVPGRPYARKISGAKATVAGKTASRHRAAIKGAKKVVAKKAARSPKKHLA